MKNREVAFNDQAACVCTVKNQRANHEFVIMTDINSSLVLLLLSGLLMGGHIAETYELARSLKPITIPVGRPISLQKSDLGTHRASPGRAG